MEIEHTLLIQLISQLGYPIVVSLLLMFYIYRVTLPLKDAIDALRERIERLQSCEQRLIETLNTFIHERDGAS